LGCGSGHTLFAVARAGFDVSGVDISQEAIDWAREKAAEAGISVELTVGDVVTLSSYSEASFGVVLDDYCLQCVMGAERAICFSNVFRILEPGGAFLAGTDCTSSGNIEGAPDPEFDAESRCLYRDGVPYSYLTLAGQLEGEVSQAGFLVQRRSECLRKPGAPAYHAGRQWIDAIKPGRLLP